jgi:hypothetical protein
LITRKLGLEPMMPRIQQEMPSIVEKLKMMEVDRVDELFFSLKKNLQKSGR